MDMQRFGAAPPEWASAIPPALAWHQLKPYESAPRYAGFWRRFLASNIDGFLMGFVIGFLSSFTSRILEPILNGDGSGHALWLILAVWVAAFWVPATMIAWLYYAGLESSARQATLGKRALGIKVTDLAGNRISFGRATGRYFAHYLSLLSLGIGYLVQPFTNQRQTLHDAVAGTVVVRARA